MKGGNNMEFKIQLNECGTYMVQIGVDLYEMSSNANMPNGVCIYCGDNMGGIVNDISVDVPQGIIKQVENIKSYYSEENSP